MTPDRLAVVCVRCKARLTTPTDEPELVVPVICTDCQREQFERLPNYDPPDSAA